MKNPFGRAVRDPAPLEEPVLSPKQLREREENERFMQKLYSGQAPRAEPEPEPEPEVPPPVPSPAPLPSATPAAIELLDIACKLLEGRDDVESRVVKVLIGRALELIPRDGAVR